MRRIKSNRILSWTRCGILGIGLTLSTGCNPPPLASDQAASTAPVQTYTVINTYPHDPKAFTQGLEFHDGYLYESTGLRGQSTLRKVELSSGRVMRRVNLPEQYFGEGIAIIEDRIYMLTWQSQTGFIFDLATFERMGRFTYAGEGWGLVYNGTHLIMSDGTHLLRFLDPISLEVVRTQPVLADGKPVARLNELEWIEGELWANLFQSDRIARIDAESGTVLAWVDAGGLLNETPVRGRVDVLNGIAYDTANERIFLTGKWWPALFEIDVDSPASGR